MKKDAITGPFWSCCRTLVFALVALFLLFGCGEEGDERSFNASDGDYSGGDGNTGIYFEIIDNQILNLKLSMTNPAADGSCLAVTSGTVTRPGEYEPFLEFVEPVAEGQPQDLVYFEPVNIDDDGKFLVEESIPESPPLCGQAFRISGAFQGRNFAAATWRYTIAGKSTNGSWQIELLSVESDLAPVALPAASIVIDGDRSDWAGIQPFTSDDKGDEDPGADFLGTDLNSFYLARDDRFLYHMVTLYDGDPPTDRTLLFSISYDKYPYLNGGTVPGDQFSTLTIGNTSLEGGMQVSLAERAQNADGSITIAQYGSEYAAVGDHFIEYKIPLKDMKSIDGKYTDLYVHVVDRDMDNLLIYTISDEMDSMARIADVGGGYVD